MVLFKKLIFALPFLFSFLYFILQLNPFLEQPEILLEFNEQVLIFSVFLIGSLLLTSLFFTIFITLASDWKIVLPAILFVSFLTFFFAAAPLSFTLGWGSFFVFIINFFLLSKKLSSYLTFSPRTLFSPTIKTTAVLLLLVSSLAFYFSYQQKIEKEGFKIPQSLLQMSVQMAGQNQTQVSEQLNQPALNLTDFNISPEQVEMLKNNPQLLKQYGLDPSLLDELSKPKDSQSQTNTSNINLVEKMVEQQVDNFLKPYLSYIPIFMAATFFLTFNFIISILSFIPLFFVWLIFYVLEKTGFISFQTETREVKKMVI